MHEIIQIMNIPIPEDIDTGKQFGTRCLRLFMDKLFPSDVKRSIGHAILTITINNISNSVWHRHISYLRFMISVEDEHI